MKFMLSGIMLMQITTALVVAASNNTNEGEITLILLFVSIILFIIGLCIPKKKD